jgi:flavin-binding protein dodecin
MAVAKVIEISAESDRSFEDAINLGISTAAKTVRNIRGPGSRSSR